MANIPLLLSSELDKYQVSNNTFSRDVKTNPKDPISIWIGDDKQPDFKPQVKLRRWEEADFSIRAEENPAATVETEGEVIKYKTPNYEVHFKDAPQASEDGGNEVYWVLNKKPKTNVLTATVQMENLDAFYQPSLTQAEIDEGAERPFDVEGSYAFYHKTKGGMNDSAGMEYKVGKSHHLYAAFAIDANGDMVKCEYNDDLQQTGVLKVTIPQDFLDTGLYPILIDPTFGYTSVGATSLGSGIDRYIGSSFTTAETGNAISMSFASTQDGGLAVMAIYNTSLELQRQTSELTRSGVWNTASLTSSYSLATSTEYWLIMVGDKDYFYYDGFAGNSTGVSNTYSSTAPSTITDSGEENKYSIYATYTNGVATQVQKKSAGNINGVTVTLDSTPTVGNMLIAVHFTRTTTSTAPAGFTQDALINNATEADQLAIYSKPVTPGDGTSYAFGGSSDYHAVTMFEYSNVYAIDKTSSTGRTTSVETLSSGTTAATSQADELIIAGMGIRGVVTSDSWDNSFTTESNQEDESGHLASVLTASKVVSSTGAQQTDASWTGSVTAMGIIATYKSGTAAAESASLSPSISPSLSPSVSPSVSPSASLSPSVSPSLSPSISPSVSPSVSPSASLSPSLSPSISPSISPSASLSPSLSPSISPSVSPSIPPDDFSQPTLPGCNPAGGWNFNSIDLQIVTKSDGWNQDQTKRYAEYDEIISKGATYAAIAVPYDNLTKYTNYVTDARTKGLKVFHRSHWNAWEGDNGSSPTMGRQQYLDDTHDFIIDNPTLFADGDLFGMCVECNNANDKGNYTFRTPETSGGTFDFTKYNQFLKDQITYANAAFNDIGKSVYTFPISMSLSLLNLNGQTLDNGDGGNASGFGNADIVSYFDGILTIDHYLSDSYRDDDNYGTKYASDLEKIHTAFPDCQIFIGEWGYHTTVAVGDTEQDTVYNDVVENALRIKSYILGVNFWVHMASNTASLWTDTSGTIDAGGRPATNRVETAFTSTNYACGGSLSPSLSPSISSSVSPSASLSPSISPSLSASLSPSISPSVSPSPSPGWEGYTRGNYVSLPTDDADLETAYSTQDYTDVDTSNDVRVGQTATGEYAIHEFKDYVGSENSCTLNWEGQSNLPPSSSAVVLQIYNQNSTTWETVDSDNTTGAGTDFTLAGNIADLTNYKTVGNTISCRVYQLSA